MPEKARLTRTTRHLTKSGHSDGEVFTIRAPDEPSFVPRLCWAAMLEKVEYDAADLCAGLAAAKDVAFFCDNSIFDDQTPDETWPSLFGSAAEVFLTPRIEEELRPWLDRRSSHPVARAIDESRLDVLTAADWSKAQQQAFIHYTNLLAMRKRSMIWGEIEFERRHGRHPKDSDANEVRSLVQRATGERGFLFARKGAQERRRTGRLSFADEELVYSAVAHALQTGRQTIILTKDEDLLDQFYRLVYLLDTHYRSMLIAAVYAENFPEFRTYPIPHRDEWAEAFEKDSGVLVQRRESFPVDVLPTSFGFVAISCWLIGERYQRLTFGAETEMNEMLEVKGRTLGKNTDRLGTRNCHLSMMSFSSPGPGIPMCFAVAEDRTVEIAGQHVPWVELNDVMMGVERFKTMRYSPVIVP